MSTIFTSTDLHLRGHNDNDIRRLVKSGTLTRLRQGWFATSQADPHAVRAVTLGGAMTCLSALRQEYWTPTSGSLHVRFGANTRRTRRDGAQVVAHTLHRGAGVPRQGTDPVPVALASALQCTTAPEWIAIADSILNAGWPPDDLADRLLEVVPDRQHLVRRLMSRTNPQSQSGSESLLRVALRSRGFRVRAHHRVGALASSPFGCPGPPPQAVTLESATAAGSSAATFFFSGLKSTPASRRCCAVIEAGAWVNGS